EVGVCELIDQDDRGIALQGGIQIELATHDAAIADRKVGKLLEALEESLGVGPSVRLYIADYDVSTVGPHAARCFQHRVGLTYARGSSEENAQAAALSAGLF